MKEAGICGPPPCFQWDVGLGEMPWLELRGLQTLGSPPQCVEGPTLPYSWIFRLGQYIGVKMIAFYHISLL